MRRQASLLLCAWPYLFQFVQVLLIFFKASQLVALPLLPDDFAQAYENFRRSNTRPDVEQSRLIDRTWASLETEVADDFIYFMHSPGDIDSAYFRQAVSHYAIALQTLHELEQARARYRSELIIIDFNRPVWWIKQEELDRAGRRQASLARAFHSKLILQFSRIFDSLERITKQEMRREPVFIKFKQQALRQYAINQLALGGFAPALDALEKYGLDATTDMEWPYHYSMQLALAGLYRQALRDRAIREGELRKLRQRKNLHALRAVELKFTRLSPEFRLQRERIRLDELGRPRA